MALVQPALKKDDDRDDDCKLKSFQKSPRSVHYRPRSGGGSDGSEGGKSLEVFVWCDWRVGLNRALVFFAAEYSPFYGIEKSAVLQEARVFNDPQLDARRCAQVRVAPFFIRVTGLSIEGMLLRIITGEMRLTGVFHSRNTCWLGIKANLCLSIFMCSCGHGNGCWAGHHKAVVLDQPGWNFHKGSDSFGILDFRFSRCAAGIQHWASWVAQSYQREMHMNARMQLN